MPAAFDTSRLESSIPSAFKASRFMPAAFHAARLESSMPSAFKASRFMLRVSCLRRLMLRV
jgi:hypothetical protein